MNLAFAPYSSYGSNEEFTVRELHVISDSSNIFGFAGEGREGTNVFTVRTVRTIRKVVHGPIRRVYGP